MCDAESTFELAAAAAETDTASCTCAAMTGSPPAPALVVAEKAAAIAAAVAAALSSGVPPLARHDQKNSLLQLRYNVPTIMGTLPCYKDKY